MKHISLRCHTYLSLILFSIREMHFRNKTQRDRETPVGPMVPHFCFLFFLLKNTEIFPLCSFKCVVFIRIVYSQG